MELFSEIYGTYYNIMAHLLRQGSQSLEQVTKYVASKGYKETASYFMPKLTNQAWPLFKLQDNRLTPKTNRTPYLPPTNLEQAWLASLLQDQRLNLFLTPEEIADLSSRLKNVKPLYNKRDLYSFDKYLDGDDYTSPTYQKHFNRLLQAISARELLKITYTGSKGQECWGHYLCTGLEYSAKNDKFRCLCLRFNRKGYLGTTIINLGRIEKIKTSGYNPSPEQIAKAPKVYPKSSNMLQVEIYPERNGLERFLMEFSTYPKTATLDEKTNITTATLYYDPADEAEILIKLLGFGPVIKVLGPTNLVKQIQERIARQCRLMEEYKH